MVMVTSETNHCSPVKRSLTGRIGEIVVPRPGWKVTSKSSQIKTIEMAPTGMTMKNHCNHVGSGCMMPIATTFCGDAMGESMPPIFDARAMPMITAFDMFESDGRVRNMGSMME